MNKKNFAVGVLLFLLGLFVMIFPLFWIKVVVIILGLGAVAYGIYLLLTTKKIYENSTYEKTILIKSIVSIITGILAVILPIVIAGIMWNIMIYILAVYMMISSFLGFYSVSLLNDSDIDRKRYILENAGLLLGALVLFLIPSKTLGTLLIRLIGLCVMIAGLAFAFIAWKPGKIHVLKKAKPADEESSDKETDDASADEEDDEAIEVLEETDDDASEKNDN